MPVGALFIHAIEALDGQNSCQSIGVMLRFRRNETVFNEGDDADHICQVVEGATRTFKILMDGRRPIAGFGLTIDLIGLGCQGEYALTAEAVTDVVVVSYQRRQVERLSETNPLMQRQLLNRVFEEISDAQECLLALGCLTALEKLAWFLGRTAERLAPAGGLHNPINEVR